MSRYFFKTLGLVVCVGLLNTPSIAQQGSPKLGDDDAIIIQKKGDKDMKVTVEIKGGEVKVNGKPLSEFKDDNVVIRKENMDDDRPQVGAFTAPRSPFRGGTWNYDENRNLRNFREDSNRPLLGVLSNTDENGAKISKVSKGSAAEKSGLKEGDIITKVNDEKVESPEALSKAIAGFKPDEKITITYLRDKKEQKSSVTLGKRQPADVAMFPPDFKFDENFNMQRDLNRQNELLLQNKLNLMAPDREGNIFFRGNGPKLGIKAQDTEDGKGVKVLDVDDGSNAGKAGIKEGDIITEFNGKVINGAGELADAAREAKDKNSIHIKFNRNGKSQEAEIKVPKKLRTATL